MEKSGFFNSDNHDRIYDASDVARILSNYFTNGIFNNGLKISSNNNMTISVATGFAHINGYTYELDEQKNIDISQSDQTLERIDSVVLRLDLNNRQISLQVLEGNYATNPTQPIISRTNNVYDLRLANILVSAGSTRITAESITDCRFSSDCGNVVQAVQHIDTEEIFEQYDTAFKNWFNNIKNQLSENQAGNLQNQITEIKDNMITYEVIEETEE